ncbi:MAG TPA: MBL fold metallo-hydrolase, partial [Gemmataceae bacterium]|nr:MBL fold metallo-hydrolase [Gemmataceae bacterium]
LVTHAHSDHWNDRTLTHLLRRGIPLYCHSNTHSLLQAYSPAFLAMEAAGLVRPFEPWQEFTATGGLHCRPLPLRHDGGGAFGFRLEGGRDLFGRAVAVGYVADLGCWDDELAAGLADVDVLAVEFNHDVAMEYASGRSPRLIHRVLGDEGHLSNAQGAALVRAVLARSELGRVRHLVQLHLSRQCNRPNLAREAALAVLEELAVRIELHTAQQNEPGNPLHLGPASGARPQRQRSQPAFQRRRVVQNHPMLPGLEHHPG